MALTSKGKVYGWGAAACGQLGNDSSKPLPKDTDGSPYQPIPSLITALANKNIISVSCGEAHSLVLDDNSIIYSFGANGCGQLGQDVLVQCDDAEKARNASFKVEKHSNEPIRVIDGRRSNVSNEESQHLIINLQALRNSRRNANTAFELYPMYKDELSIVHFHSTPKIIRSLVSKNVLKISSGGVHNLAIVEENNNSLQASIYMTFITGAHTDFNFIVEGITVRTHKVILSYKSSYFAAFFTANKDLKEIELKNTRYKPFRLILDYIYLADLTLMDIEGFDDELIDTYKFAKKYGLAKLQEEIKNRLHNKLKGITIDESKDGKKKCKAMNVIESLSELEETYKSENS